MAAKERLGKGLSALISDELLVEDNNDKEAVEYVDIDLISPNKNST